MCCLGVVTWETSGDDCFQCGEPVPSGSGRGLEIEGQWHRMCSAHCETLALSRFPLARARNHAVLPPEAPANPVASVDLQLYDDPQVQSGFVRAKGGELEAVLLIEGIRCGGCASRNERTLAALPGVLGAEVNFSTHRATVRWDGARIKLSEILAAVERIGYRASPYDRDGSERRRGSERRDALWRLFVAGFGMMQVMMYAVPAYLAGDGEMSADIEQLMRWASFVLTVPVVIYAASPFFRGAWRDLAARRLGMDVPVAMGIAVAFGASVVATLTGGAGVYYDSVTMFVFLLLVGRYLDLLARQRVALALSHLDRLVPEFAHRLTSYPHSRDTVRVPVAGLSVGEHVLVKAGETFPADGLVAEGASSASEALLSGESRPVEKAGGAEVIGGSLNLISPLVVRITRVGQETVLSSILNLIGRATAEKPRLIKLADRVASHFILGVLLLALAAGVFWAMTDPARIVLVVVSVLVATCPCALSLAMPVALTAAAGTLGSRGLLVCKPHVIEGLAGATDIVFDKTGTLTRGEPRLMDVHLCGSLSRDVCLDLASALEAESEHPLAGAFPVLYPRKSPMASVITDVRNVPGAGIEARLGGRTLRLGSAAFVSEIASCTGFVRQVSRDTHIWLGDSRGLLASFRLADTVRLDAAGVVSSLASAGLKVHLLSGDDHAATFELAELLGIRNTEARANPERKLAYVRALQKSGRKVIMVGDGINDSPVLAQADVSIAMGSGTRLAQMEADSVLIDGALGSLPGSIALARRTMRVIRQNVAWAFAYNLLVLPLAIAGVLTPWAAAIGMSASSLIVVLNALRLQEFHREDLTRAALPLVRPVAV